MISGLTIIRNGIKYDYPFIESLKSMLPICDEIIVVAGNSEDGTNRAILALNEPKIRFIHTIWDEQLRTGGKILAQQTNIGIQAIKGDWILYLQGDEVLHENAKEKILKGIAIAEKIMKSKAYFSLIIIFMALIIILKLLEVLIVTRLDSLKIEKRFILTRTLRALESISHLTNTSVMRL